MVDVAGGDDREADPTPEDGQSVHQLHPHTPDLTPEAQRAAAARRLQRTIAGNYVRVWLEGQDTQLSPADLAAAIALETARDHVERASRDAARAQDELRRAIDTYRRKGATWDDVGRLFGITRQAAAKRFAPLEERRPRELGQ